MNRSFVFILSCAVGVSVSLFAQNPEPANWSAGDMHVHRSCGGAPQAISTIHDKMNDQNLAALSLLADVGNGEVQDPAQDLPRVNGFDDPISTSGRIVHWDAEWHWDATYSQYPHQALGGHVLALGLNEAHQIWQEYTYPIFQWAHSQNAIAGFAHMQYLDNGIPQSLTCCTPVEYPVEIALGASDFISEDVNGSDTAIQAYYRLLNSGFRPGFAAGTDYPCNDGTTIGAPLTYARIANGQMNYRNWIDAISNGRTVVSLNGHSEFLDLAVNGTARPGDEIRLAGSGNVSISVQWNATKDLSGTIELVSNGVVVASKQASVSPSSSATLTATVSFPKSGWIAARRMGSNGHAVHTAAVFVIVNNAPIRVNTTDPQFYIDWINSLLTRTSPGGDWNWYFPTSLSAAQGRYVAARTLYQQILKEAQGTAPALSSITVSAANQTISSGSTQQLVATAIYSDGSTANISSQVTWSSSNANVASINLRGLAAAANSGTTIISATQSGVTGSTTLNVQTVPLTITTQSPATGTVGVAYSMALAASGGTPPYTWAVASGSLPSGLSLNNGTGTISGTPSVPGTFNFNIEVVDSATPAQTTVKTLTITIAATGACPCTIWSSTTTPSVPDAGPDAPVELGVSFRADTDGYITAIRFYKGAGNTGTHVANLWNSSGALLATATFANETSTGWQQVGFASPVLIKANTVYTASYHTNVGHYADDQYYFGNGVDRAPLHAAADGVSGANGVYAYGSSSAFPDQGWHSSNYWVDVVFTPAGPDTTAPNVSSVSPAAGATGVGTNGLVLANFSEALDATTVNNNSFQLLDSTGAPIVATVTYDASVSTAKLQTSSPLPYSSTYTAVIKGGAIKDLAGNVLLTDYRWSFTTAAAPVPPPNDGPGGPILIVSSTSNPFSRYYPEILRAEGLNEFTAMDISLVSSSTLANYDVVILGEFPLTSSQVSIFSSWVASGGNLIAMRPDKQLANLLGVTYGNATLDDAYLLLNTSSGPASGLVNQTIQFHGTADLYSLNGATSLATLFSNANTSTAKPAVTLNQVGLGKAAAFTYDLARSVVYTRQGNPAWAGQARDGQSGPMRSDDLFFGDASFDSQNDYVDLTKVAIPQADEQQRLLANLILQMNQSKRPLPRFWYFPRGLKAVVVMTGDDHGELYRGGATADRFDYYASVSPSGCSVADWQCVRATAYLLAPNVANNPLTNAQAAEYAADGFEIGVHVDSVPDCVDWTPSELASDYSTQIASFAAKYPSLTPAKTHRMHCVSWSDYDSQPQVELQNGIRLDTTYYYWPDAWVNDRPGMFTGSGMPMRLTKRDGTLLDIYQAATQMTDESGQSYPMNVETLLNNALGSTGYYGAFTTNMHNDSASSDGAEAIIESAQARGVPVISAAQLLTWLDGRNGSSFSSLTWSGNTLSFSIQIASGANGLQAMLPITASSGVLSNLTLSGSPVPYSSQTIKGISYAVFTAAAGTYAATYAGTVPVSITSVVMNPSTVVGGRSSTGTITLTGPAPAGGAMVALSTNDVVASSLPQAAITVPQGSTTATFLVNANIVSSTTNVIISASYGGANASTLLTITPLPAVASVSLSPTTLLGGQASTGTVTITQAAGVGGTVVNLSSGNTSVVTVPGSVTVQPGSTSATFAAGTYSVANQTAVSISASLNSSSQTAVLTVNPPPPVVITTQQLPAGMVSNAYSTTLSASGGTAPYVWTISSGSLPSGLSLGNTSGVISGTPAAAGTFAFTLKAIDSATPPQTASQALSISITAPGVCPCSIWSTSTAPITADSGPDSAVELGVNFRADADGYITGIRFYKGSGNTGTHVGNLWSSSGALLATATFANESATGWQQVNFSSPVAISANTVYVASYHTSAGHYADDQNFFVSPIDKSPLHALADGAGTPNGVFAYGSTSSFPNQSWHASNYWVDVIFVPGPPPAVTIASVTLTPTSVLGGTSSTGTVTLTGAAPAGGITLSLASDNASVATAPSSIIVAANSSTATFTVTTVPVAANATATITASYGSATKTATLTVTSPSLSSLTLNPTRVKAGTSSTGTATLSGPAPPGGIVLAVSRTGSNAIVPASVTVPPASKTATFSIGTATTTITLRSTISATYKTVARSATLTISP